MQICIENAKQFGLKLEQKSAAAEQSVIELINEFMSEIYIEGFDEELKFNWLSVERALRSDDSLPRIRNVPNDYGNIPLQTTVY